MNQVDGKIFTFDKLTVFFKHTDYYGELHPYNYYEWTSYVREEFFAQKCKGFREILNTSIRMMTTKIEAKVYSDAIFGDVVEGRLYATRVRKSSMDLVIEFINKKLGKKLAVTQHSLVFFDSITETFAPIPPELKSVALEYQRSVE